MSPIVRVCLRHGVLYEPPAVCPECKRTRGGNDAARARRQRTWTQRWRNLSDAVIARAGGYCEIHLEGCTVVATTAHLSPALRGRHDEATIDDCVAACRHCHGVVDGRRGRKNLQQAAPAMPFLGTGEKKSAAKSGPAEESLPDRESS
jgi:hypothetical protein